MLDMTNFVDEQKYFITDLKKNEQGMMEISFADGTTREEPYSEHNFNFYRRKMVNQAKTYSNSTINTLGISYIKTQLFRILCGVGGVFGMYFLYNVDIHIIIKIVLVALLILGEAAMMFFTHLHIMMLEDYSLETFSYLEYLKHLDNFIYYDKETGIEHYLLPIEDIDREKVDPALIASLNENIERMVKEGSLRKDIRIKFNKIDNNKIKKG